MNKTSVTIDGREYSVGYPQCAGCPRLIPIPPGCTFTGDGCAQPDARITYDIFCIVMAELLSGPCEIKYADNDAREALRILGTVWMIHETSPGIVELTERGRDIAKANAHTYRKMETK